LKKKKEKGGNFIWQRLSKTGEWRLEGIKGGEARFILRDMA